LDEIEEIKAKIGQEDVPFIEKAKLNSKLKELESKAVMPFSKEYAGKYDKMDLVKV